MIGDAGDIMELPMEPVSLRQISMIASECLIRYIR